MKKLFILVSILFCQYIAVPAQPCLPYGVALLNQNNITTFPSSYPDCTIIEGNLDISTGASGTDLSGLSQITAINGTLRLEGNWNLTSLAGLENITYIRGDLLIYNNADLLDLSGLSGLQSVG